MCTSGACAARLRSEFELEPVEYSSTRAVAASPTERAGDIMTAFADPTIAAILATIGGDDQITVLRHLDPAVVAANPKPFFGYSDSTNLLNFLWYAGVVGFHGGSVLVHLARPGGMHPLTAASLRAALFTAGEYELVAPDEFGDETIDWAVPANLERDPPMRLAQPWTWRHADQVVQGPTWGGNLEILSWLLAADRFVAAPQDYDGAVLFIETSEEMPPARRGVPDAAQHGRARRVVAVRCGADRASQGLELRSAAGSRGPGPSTRRNNGPPCARRWISTTRASWPCSMWTSGTPTHS